MMTLLLGAVVNAVVASTGAAAPFLLLQGLPAKAYHLSRRGSAFSYPYRAG
jgi:NhaP-type Na+/H+ and K+/H+ antiporter